MNLGKKKKRARKKKEATEREAKGVSAAGPGHVLRGLRGRSWPMPISGTKGPESGLAEQAHARCAGQQDRLRPGTSPEALHSLCQPGFCRFQFPGPAFPTTNSLIYNLLKETFLQMLKLCKVPLLPLKPTGSQTRRSFQKHEPGSPKNLAKGLCQLEGSSHPCSRPLVEAPGACAPPGI